MHISLYLAVHTEKYADSTDPRWATTLVRALLTNREVTR